LSTSAPTCSADATLILGTLALGTLFNASWGTPDYNGLHYSVVATADSGHKFANASNVSHNNSIETFTGTLASKLSSTDPKCVTVAPPVCIPASAVSYTYNPSENSGTITVGNVPNSTNKLCEAFYVTATSWKFTQDNNIWPQQLDVVNDYYIDGPGEFPYSASVHCGQGDIYASYLKQIVPTATLTGSSDWEHFLYEMGFKGDSPTYTVSPQSCFTSVPVTGTPTETAATCAAPNGNSLVLPAVSGGVWAVKSGGHTTTLPIGTGKDLGTVYGFGAYTISLSDGDPHDGFDVVSSDTPWTPVDISTVDCNTTITPIVPTSTPAAGCGTTGSLNIPADTAEVKYTLQGDGHTGTNKVTATAQGTNEFAGTPPTQTESWTFELGSPTPCITVTPSAPTVTAQTCVAGNLVGGTITVENQPGLVFTIAGGPSKLDITPAVGTTTDLLPGTYTVTVAVDNSSNPNYVLAPGSTTSFPLVVGAAVDCRTIAVAASSTDAVCSSTPEGATPETYVRGVITIAPDADVTYWISDGTTTTELTKEITSVDAGTYTVTALLTTGAQAAGTVLSASSWGPFVIAPVNCAVATALVGDPSVSSCDNLTADTTLLSWVHVDAVEHVSYQIYPAGDPSASTGLVAGYSSQLPGDYTVVATADSGYTLDVAGDTSSTTAQWNVTVADTSFCLSTGATWHAGASADPAVCVSTTSQLGTIHLTHYASEIGEVTYTITNSSTQAVVYSGADSTSVKVGPGDYVVTAAAVKQGDGLSTASTFNLTVAAAVANCTVPTSLVGDPSGSSCDNLTFDTTLLSWVHVDAVEHVSYQIYPAGDPSASTDVVADYTSELPGDYTVVATADSGYTLDVAGDTSSSTAQWNVTVADTSFCLSTDATWHAGASADPAVCVSTTSQLGTIHLTHYASELGEVTYTITNSTTQAVVYTGADATSVKVGPGDYVVTAAAVTEGDGLSTASTFNLTIAAAAAACAMLSTLAFTGVPASLGILGLLLAGGMLFLGFAAIFIRVASRRNAD
jgi:hypothetical protein